jgi:hypothetical protein
MARIIDIDRNRPSGRQTAPVQPSASRRVSPAQPSRTARKASSSPMSLLHMGVVLMWPLLRWVMAVDTTWQLARMLYFWDTQGTYAGWTFLLHFGVFVALTYFVSVYRPDDTR